MKTYCIPFLSFFLLVLFAHDLSAQKNIYRIGFYNVENLFDLEDTPDKIDDYFTPEGKNKWTQERYDKKVGDLTKVLKAMGSPALIGLCEVETLSVCEDMAAHENLSSGNYGVVHFESPDARGIDNALMYQKDLFKVSKAENIVINFPAEIVEDYTTRDILYVNGLFKNKEIHIFVNHWPSRRGGLEESQPKRVYVASQLRKKVDEILNKNKKARIIIMGDFNDEPDNDSLTKALNASSNYADGKKTQLINCMSSLDQAGKGTYNYRGNWNMLDQFVASPCMIKRGGFKYKEAQIFREDWMVYKSEKYGETPNRTYGGPNYYGGISDHFPIYFEFKAK